MKIAVLGRTRWLVDTATLLAARGHALVAVEIVPSIICSVAIFCTKLAHSSDSLES